MDNVKVRRDTVERITHQGAIEAQKGETFSQMQDRLNGDLAGEGSLPPGFFRVSMESSFKGDGKLRFKVVDESITTPLPEGAEAIQGDGNPFYDPK